MIGNFVTTLDGVVALNDSDQSDGGEISGFNQHDFTLGLLTVLGRCVPVALWVFFATLAIADDLGAVLVIALFYSSGISWLSLAAGLMLFLALLGLNRARTRAVAILPHFLSRNLILHLSACGTQSSLAPSAQSRARQHLGRAPGKHHPRLG